MQHSIHSRNPVAEALARQFVAKFQSAPPPTSKFYNLDKPQPVTAIPEYAPMGGVLIAYPGTKSPAHRQEVPIPPRAFGIPNELIVRMQQNDTDTPVHVFVMCVDTAAKAEIDHSLSMTAKELRLLYNPDNLHLVPWDTDTFWTRDYAPWWVRNTVTKNHAIAKHIYTTLGGGSVGLVEGAEDVDPHVGNGIFRPNDDYGAVAFSDFLNAPIRAWNKAGKLPALPAHDWFFTGLLDVGGNYMVTGQNKIASSYLVATQNELPTLKEDETTNPSDRELDRRFNFILEQLNRFMGIKHYHVLTDPTGTYIGHIDCWGKFLSDDKVLIAKSKDPQINDGLNKIALSFERDGFTVYRVKTQPVTVISEGQPTQTTAAYTNSLILNNCVYVPIAGAGYESDDKNALAVYESALPGYKVVGIPPKPEFPWLGTDAMHCRTHGVPRDVVDIWLASQK